MTHPDSAMDCTHPCVIFLIAVTLVLSGSVVPSDASFRKIPEGRREAKQKISGNVRAASPPRYNKPPEGRRRHRVEVKTLKQVSFIHSFWLKYALILACFGQVIKVQSSLRCEVYMK